jgi:hypothetical protein
LRRLDWLLVLSVGFGAMDGESNWMEGIMTGSPLAFSAPVKCGVCEPVGCSGLFGLSRLFG